MADIELVIKIPEEIYKHILSMQFYIPGSRSGKSLLEKILKAIRTGTPLPKGHGDLIDKSKIYKAISAEEDNLTGAGMTFEEMDAYNDGIDAMYSLVKGARPIIETDKGE